MIRVEKTPFPKSRKLIKPEDGTIAYTWDGKLHNWEGPALYPEGNKKYGEYHLYGIKYNKEEWSEIRQQREGLPYYKNQSMKAHLSDYRN
tara:strand:+ start:52 stop:321 length:270 start_codon:yes stop_codon:yes gene_type:complete